MGQQQPSRAHQAGAQVHHAGVNADDHVHELAQRGRVFKVVDVLTDKTPVGLL